MRGTNKKVKHMADPLRHDCALDVAEEILGFIAGNPDAEEVRVILRSLLDMNDEDFGDAHEVVRNIRDVFEEQKY